MRGLIFLLLSIVLLSVVIWGRDRADSLRFVVPANGADVLYATSFGGEQANDDWFTEERQGGAIDVTDAALQLSLGERVPARERLLSTNTYLFGDFDLRVEAAAVGGPLNNSYGVVFRRLDEATYYLFYVSSDGYYSVWRETPESVIKLSDWIPSEIINQGVAGETNALRVVGEGDTFRFYANGEPLEVCIPDSAAGESTFSAGECVGGTMQAALVDDTAPYGGLGVAIETIMDGGMTATFDDVVVLPVSGG